MDLSKLSDDDLEALSRRDISSLSDEGLDLLSAQRISVPKPKTQPTYSSGRAAIEGFGQGATLGYLPQIQAALGPDIERTADFVTGQDATDSPMLSKVLSAATLAHPSFALSKVLNKAVMPDEKYISARDENIRRQEVLQKESPLAYTGGQVAGTLASSIAPGGAVAKGKGLVGLAKGAAIGAAEAAAVNPGDVEGEFSPIQLKERLSNAKLGAMFGAGGHVVSRAVAKGVETAKKGAHAMAFKQAGAMLKDFRAASSRKEVDELGRFMLDKVLKAGDSFDDVAAKAGALKSQSGQEIGKIYREVVVQVGDDSFWSRLTPAKKSALSMTGFKPSAQKAEIMAKIADDLGDSPNAKSAISFVSDYIDDLGEKYKEGLDIVRSNKIKGDIDGVINYGRRVQDLPEKQQALSALRNYIRDRIEEHIDVLDDIVGSSKVSELRKANKVYGAASQIEGIAFDRVQRENANRFFSLGDRITGAAGSGVGAAAGFASGGDLESTLKGAAIGAGSAMASRAARRFGPGLAARGFDIAGKRAGAALVPTVAASAASKGYSRNRVEEEDDTISKLTREKLKNLRRDR